VADEELALAPTMSGSDEEMPDQATEPLEVIFEPSTQDDTRLNPGSNLATSVDALPEVSVF
jgi:hypothetical protein